MVIGAGQGEFGSVIRVWPSSHNYAPDRCPRGHLLAIGGRNGGFDHYHRAATLSCSICQHAECGGQWALIDPTEQITEAAASSDGTELVAYPPLVRAGVGRIALRVAHHFVGDVHLMVCAADKLGVVEDVQVDPEHWRMGYSRLLVAAARARGKGYSWSTTKLGETFEARAFWSRVAWPGVGEPKYCGHMLDAAELTP
jgi:GNAT superfamily N-acetyltransferase